MPTNIHALAQLLRARQLEAMQIVFPEVHFRAGTHLTRDCVGIHLLSPETWDVSAAVEQAERDGYEVVYIYN